MNSPTAVIERCHDDPEPDCSNCVEGIAVEALRLLLRKQKREAYWSWGTTSYNQLTVYLDFLERVQ